MFNMKKKSLLNFVLVLMFSMIVISACKKDKGEATTNVPSKMTITIPSSLNEPGSSKKSDKGGIVPLKGNDIYANLRLFIGVGAGGAAIVDGIMLAVSIYNLTALTSPVSFKSNGDGLTKTLTVSKDGAFNGITYQWKMVIQDYNGSQALQLFFNTSPIKGVAIYQASKLNHKDWFSILHPNALVQIEYSEAEIKYQKQMIVTIAGLTPYGNSGLDNLKLFVGKNGDILDIYGNSNHPNCVIFDPNPLDGKGIDWAFVAHSNDRVNIGVAKVALPKCNLSDTALLFTKYSIHQVLTDELNHVFNNNIPADSLTKYLQNAETPGYFQGPPKNGFVSSGTNVPNIAEFTPAFLNLSGLKPYVPFDIKNLTLSFSK
jgi:hypothetical protein